MKKLAILAVALTVGVGVAFASSLSVPWFVDNAPQYNGIPGKKAGVTGIVTLKSNRTDTVVCSITYVNQDGVVLGPFPPNNTFTIAPLSALAFRPVEHDPDPTAGGQPGGQEGSQGVVVPDRPRSPDSVTPIPGTSPPTVDLKKNGSITVSWTGGPQDIQGIVTWFQSAIDPISGATITFSYGTVLPPGF